MTFREASKTLLFAIMEAVTEIQTEHNAFRFVYFRTLAAIRNDILEAYQGDPEIDQVYAYMSMFGGSETVEAAQLFSKAVYESMKLGSYTVSVLAQDRGYKSLPLIVNIIVKPQTVPQPV